MTYGRVRRGKHECNIEGAVVSHLAELVRGDLFSNAEKAPSSGLRPPSPQGETGFKSLGHASRWRSISLIWQ